MQNVSTSRREDLALVRAWAKGVYADKLKVGAVHRGARGWVAETSSGRIIGKYASEQLAVRAVLRAGAPR